MNPLELRKTILVGRQFACPETPPLIGPDGQALTPIPGQVVTRIVFWIPQKPPYQRRGVTVNPNATIRDRLCDPLEGCTIVHDVRPFEIQALRDGAIVEEVYDFTYEKDPSLDQLRKDVQPIWERKTLESLGYLPNGAPVDNDPKLSVQFTAV